MGVSVVVLAGGRSSRFGSPKLEAVLDGRPILEHVVELARSLSDDVVVAVSASGDATLSLPEGVRAVRDPEAFGGPLAGLASALDAVDREIAIVLAGDMPRLAVQLVEPMLITFVTYPDVDIVVLERDGQARPLPLVARSETVRGAARALLDGTGEHSLRALLAAVNTRSIDEAHWRRLDPTRDALADVDRPEDLAALEVRDPDWSEAG
jgi:molybdopterin-guanine dinucleotide biosynthesis protein A